MPKNTLIEAKLLDKILSFFGGSSTNTKEKFISSVQQTNPTLARALSTWETDFLNLLLAVKKSKIKYNQDTSEIDKMINKIKG